MGKMKKMKKRTKRLQREEEVGKIDQMPTEEKQKTTNHGGTPDDAEGGTGATVLMPSLTDQIFGNPVIRGKIFSFLPSEPSAVKAASLVCRAWNSQLDKPKYWTWAVPQLDRETFNQIFNSRRFRIISSVVIRWSLTADQIITLIKGLGKLSLKKLFASNSFIALAPGVLAHALVSLEEVDLERCLISREQAEALFQAIGETEQLKLKVLKLGHADYGEYVEPELFKHLLRIKDLKVEVMDPKQVVAFYKSIEETKDLQLKKFTFGTNSATFIMEEDILARTWPRLERIVIRTEAGMPMPSIYSEQVEAVFKEIIRSKDFKLKSVQLPSHIRAELPHNILTETKAKISVVFSDDEDAEAE